MRPYFILALVLLLATGVVAKPPANVPSIPGVDAPELAALGRYGVGFRTITLINRAQPDVESVDPVNNTVPLRDRKLVVDLWYPAAPAKGNRRITYRASLPGEPPKPPVTFTQMGIAVAGAKSAGEGHPWVIISHGYSNAPPVMTWLMENLASKGYVVAAIHHSDPNPYVVSAQIRAAPNFNRPRDIAFVARQLRATLGAQIDPGKLGSGPIKNAFEV